eukprot:6084882-Prymnesium_polylepis.1
MGRLTHHNTPGPVGRPRCDSVGHAIIASVEAGGEQGRDRTYAHPNVVTRPAADRHYGAHAIPRPQAPARANSER